MKNTKSKICSRGHKFKGSGPCPVCWPGRLKKIIKSKYEKSSRTL